jgi:hypothetical protein
MNVQIVPKPRVKALLQFRENLTPEHGETFTLQEQFSGPIPPRFQRPAGEILAERLAESGPDGAPPVFIP